MVWQAGGFSIGCMWDEIESEIGRPAIEIQKKWVKTATDGDFHGMLPVKNRYQVKSRFLPWNGE